MPNARDALLLAGSHPEVFCYLKDTQSRFCYLNEMTWLGLGARTEDECLGKTDMDFHPPALARAYMAEDQKVLAGKPVFNRLWLVHHLGLRLPQWVASSKIPLRDIKGRIVGLAGAMHQLEAASVRDEYFQEIEPTINYIEENISEQLNMDDVARQVPCSRTQLNRRFRELLHMTPTDYIMAIRVQRSRHLLASTDLSLAEIAMEAGFCDQSHMTRRFRAITGETPAAFRRAHRERPGA